MYRACLTLIILLSLPLTLQAKRSELVMATTFSPQATAYIISRWQHQPGAVPIRTINRTSASLEQLLDNLNDGHIDLVLTSSPMLLQHLQDHHRLAPIDAQPAELQRQIPESIRATSVAVALSGFGLLINRSNLAAQHLPPPKDWEDLTQPQYRDMLLMSSPSRSDTNHLMIESLLQQYGWQRGWQILLMAAGNLSTISSRSFGVADKIQTGLGTLGPVIDNYAQMLSTDPHLTFHYFPHSVAAPTYVAVARDALYPGEARRFIRFLLSPDGQRALADTNTGKYPIVALPGNSARAQQQRRLLAQPQMDYRLILLRQRLVQALFDTAISFRLPQLKDAWRALNAAESRQKHPLPHIRALLTAMPISAAQSEDPKLLAQCSSRAGCEQLMMEWQQFFHQKQRQAINQLENLK
ncbi:ABC transporter substrate-binding protein [Edwardsiella anguillarum]|uniref:ABC transporter substrate-binding protein n=1 Tax=Edwardsiella anguillarum TaxID=1821960 RepID=UPI0024B68C8E|nr:ABC transporter substrate-binding protein [Edwardsiella anguillarum]